MITSDTLNEEARAHAEVLVAALTIWRKAIPVDWTAERTAHQREMARVAGDFGHIERDHALELLDALYKHMDELRSEIEERPTDSMSVGEEAALVRRAFEQRLPDVPKAVTDKFTSRYMFDNR